MPHAGSRTSVAARLCTPRMTRNPHWGIVAAILMCVLGGCATQVDREDSRAPGESASLIYQAQVALGSCVFRPQVQTRALDAIAGALLASTVSQGINHLGKAIEEAGAQRTDQVSASRNVEVSATTMGPCLQIVRGWFHRGFANAQDDRLALQLASGTWAAPGAGGRSIDASRLTLLWQRRLLLAAQPDFVFEAQIVPSALAVKPDTRLLTLAPVYARLDHPVSAAALRPSKSREVAVFFAFHEASTEPADPRHAAGGLVLGRLDPGVGVLFPALDNDTSTTPNRAAGESRWFTLALGPDRKAMTLTALVTEHQDAQAFLAFVAAVITGAKTPLANALEAIIVPSERALVEDTARTKDDASRNAYEDALAKAMAAATRCAAGVSDALTSASDVRVRVRTMNRHARALGRPEVDEALVPLDLDPKRVQAGCSAMRGALTDSLRGA